MEQDGYDKDFAAALAPAQRAAEIATNNPIVLDTLGWVLYNNNQIARAESTLQRALNLSNLPRQEIPVNIHLGLVKLAQDDVRTSRRFADRASELIRRSPELADDFQSDLNDLIQSLEQAEETAGLQQ